MAENQTRVNCLEGSFANHYTTITVFDHILTAGTAGNIWISAEVLHNVSVPGGHVKGHAIPTIYTVILLDVVNGKIQMHHYIFVYICFFLFISLNSFTVHYLFPSVPLP